MYEIVLDDWQHFLRLVDDFQRAADARQRSYIYRGVPKATYELKPSLLRLLEVKRTPDIVFALTVEDRALHEFIRQAHLHLPIELLATLERRWGEDIRPDSIEWWTLMQHYGAPTRLLDWTRSLLVAAYFASEKDFAEDGAIWVLDGNWLAARMRKDYGRTQGPGPEVIAERFLNAEAVPAVWPIDRPRATDRIVAQQGVFTIAERILTNHGEEFEHLAGDDAEVFSRMVVRSELKPVFLERLLRLNVTANALFPGIDGLGRSIAEEIRVAVQR